MDAKTDLILDTLINAQAHLNRVRADKADAEAEALAERDAALVRARKTGVGPTELARLIGVKRNAVYKALRRDGLR